MRPIDADHLLRRFKDKLRSSTYTVMKALIDTEPTLDLEKAREKGYGGRIKPADLSGLAGSRDDRDAGDR